MVDPFALRLCGVQDGDFPWDVHNVVATAGFLCVLRSLPVFAPGKKQRSFTCNGLMHDVRLSVSNYRPHVRTEATHSQLSTPCWCPANLTASKTYWNISESLPLSHTLGGASATTILPFGNGLIEKTVVVANCKTL